MGCGESPKTAPSTAISASPDSSQPTTVQATTPRTRTINRVFSQPGSIEAFEQTPIFAKVPGYVHKWAVDMGDEVKKGQLLAELWVPELVSELDLKKEQVQQAKKTLALSKTQVITAKAQVDEAEAALSRALALGEFWKGQDERFTTLVTQNVLDKQSREETHNQYRAATAALTEARAKISTSKALLQEKEIAIDKSEIDVRAAEAELQRQADLVRYCTFLAPYDGVVTRRTINTFDFVQPPTAGKGDPLYVVERRDIMRVFVEVPEAEAVLVHKGAPASVRVQAFPGREFSGTVERTSYSLDRTTRTLVAEIDFANPKDELRPGMYAFATIQATTRDVLSLPATSVVTEGDVNVGYKTFCFFIENGALKRTQVEIGVRNAQFVQVLRKLVPGGRAGEAPNWKAFSGSEEVVPSDLAGLKDGQQVEVARAKK
jgi:multidrug efflux pump subunit AcrA (membrane-fusion protein)